MTWEPRKIFVTKPETDGDTQTHGPSISSIVATEDGRVVMADGNNNMIKVADLTDPANTIQSVTLGAVRGELVWPKMLALLQDKQVAVTASEKSVHFVDVSGHPTVVSHVQTARQYCGVSAVKEDDTLVVSCDNVDGPASVDVISRAGVVLKTIVDSNTLTDLSGPYNLCVTDGLVVVSDYRANAFFEVQLETGRVRKIMHPDLKGPWGVATDHAETKVF
nr:hypothetical protein BaRGS_015207 [Batillaria attramentaria]